MWEHAPCRQQKDEDKAEQILGHMPKTKQPDGLCSAAPAAGDLTPQKDVAPSPHRVAQTQHRVFDGRQAIR
jgi:hypothetical protein